MAVLNPRTILTQLKKIKGVYRPKPADPKTEKSAHLAEVKPEAAFENLDKGLVALREFARKEKNEENRGRFTLKKKEVVKTFRVYVKDTATQTSNKNSARLPTYKKGLAKLLKGVLALSFAELDDTENTIDLDREPEVDPQLLEDETEESTPGSTTTPTPPPRPTTPPPTTGTTPPPRPTTPPPTTGTPPPPRPTTPPPTTTGTTPPPRPTTPPPTPPTPTTGPTPPPPPRPPTPPLSPLRLQAQETNAKKGSLLAKNNAETKLKEAEQLTLRADRKRRIAEHDGHEEGTEFLASQTRLELELVSTKKEAQRQQKLAQDLETQAAQARLERQKLQDEQAFANLPRPEAMLLASTQTKLDEEKVEAEKAKTKAKENQTKLEDAIYRPREAEQKLNKTQQTVTNLERLIHDEKARIIVMPKKRKERDATVKEYEAQLVVAKQELITARSDSEAATNKARFIVGTEGKLRANAINARVEAADQQIGLRDTEAELAARRVGVLQDQRQGKQAAFDRAFEALPGGPKLLEDIGKAEAQVTEKAALATATRANLDGLMAIARGDMEEPALQDAHEAVAHLEDEAKNLKAALDKAANQLLKARAAKLPPTELQPFLDQVAAATKASDDQQMVLDEARANEATLKLSAGDATEVAAAKTKRDEAQAELDRCVTALKDGQTANLDPAALKELQAKVAEAQATLLPLAALAGVGERGARIAATPLPAKRAELKKVEGQRDQLIDVAATEQAKITDILTRNKLSGKISKDDKKLVDAALQKANEKKAQVEQGNDLVQHHQDLVDEAGGDAAPAEVKERLARAKRLREVAKTQLEAAQKEYADAEKAGLANAEKKLSKEDAAALAQARERKTRADSGIQLARTRVGNLQNEIKDTTNALAAPEILAAKTAATELTTADEEAQRLDGEFKTKVDGSPEAKLAQTALEEADGVVERAKAQEADAAIATAAAHAEDLIARVQQEALDNVTAESKAFAKFADLTSEDFEEALRQGVNASKIGAKFPPLPEKPARFKNPQEEAAFNLQYEQVAKTRAEYTEALRQAQEAMDRLVERDALLQEAGASFEDRKQAFAHIPEALLPAKFREELQAYREVEELFGQEEEEERIKEANKAEAKESILSALGDLAALAEPIVSLFCDAMDTAGAFGDAGSFKNAGFDIASMISTGIGGLLADKEMFVSEKETLDRTLTPAEEEEAQRRKLLDEDKKVEILKFLKDMVIAQAKQSASILGIIKTATDAAPTSALGHAVPGIGAVIASLEAAIEIGKAAQLSVRAAREGSLFRQVRAENEDEALVRSMDNQSGRSANRAVKQSIHAGAKTVQAGGAIGIAAGGPYGAAGGAVVVGVGKGIEYGNKAAFQCIDWAQAAKAAKTLELARAGSHQAMQEIFKDHQKYATMYICLKAKNGDARSLKFCQIRGLDRAAVLDSATSMKLIRQEMLKAVDQADHMATFGEDVVSAWDKVAKGGKLLAKGLTFAGDALTGGGVTALKDAIKEGVDAIKEKIHPTPPPPVIEAPGNRPTPEHFVQISLRADTLLAKVTNGEDITDKDVADRNFYLKQITVWEADLVGDDWPEPQLQKQGGKTARVRINAAKQAFTSTPSVATVTRQHAPTT